MVNFRNAALALGWLAAIATVASGQYSRFGQQPNQRQQRQDQQQDFEDERYPQSQYRQQRERSGDRSYSATPDQYGRQQMSNADRKIAMLLANSNKGEIRLARYALNRLEGRDVRMFADSLVQDHQQILDQLRRYVPEIARNESGGDRGDRDSRRREGEDRRSGQNRRARTWDDATVAQQISERLARKARDELSEKEGWELDHTFVGQQLVSHQQHIAKMEVYRQYASPDLRQVIDEAIQITEGHEQEARELVQELGRRRHEYAEGEGQESEHASRRERSDTERSDRDRSDRDRSESGEQETEEAFFESSERRETNFGEERESRDRDRGEASEEEMEADDDDRRESDEEDEEEDENRAERDSEGRRVREREERDNQEDREE